MNILLNDMRIFGRFFKIAAKYVNIHHRQAFSLDTMVGRSQRANALAEEGLMRRSGST